MESRNGKVSGARLTAPKDATRGHTNNRLVSSSPLFRANNNAETSCLQYTPVHCLSEKSALIEFK